MLSVEKTFLNKQANMLKGCKYKFWKAKFSLKKEIARVVVSRKMTGKQSFPSKTLKTLSQLSISFIGKDLKLSTSCPLLYVMENQDEKVKTISMSINWHQQTLFLEISHLQDFIRSCSLFQMWYV